MGISDLTVASEFFVVRLPHGGVLYGKPSGLGSHLGKASWERVPRIESPACCVGVSGLAGGDQVGCTLLVGIGGATALVPPVIGAVHPDITRLVVPASKVVKTKEISEGLANDGDGAGHPAVTVIVVVTSSPAAALETSTTEIVLTAAGAVGVQFTKDTDESVELEFGSTKPAVM